MHPDSTPTPGIGPVAAPPCPAGQMVGASPYTIAGYCSSVTVAPTATSTPVVPEWSPAWLFAVGLLALAVVRRRRG